MENGELYFSVKGMLAENPVSPDNISLPILTELADAIGKFIRGSSRAELNDVPIAIKHGSFAMVAQSSPITTAAIADFREVVRTGSLDRIDTIRARVIADLQKKANQNNSLIFTIADSDVVTNTNSIIINKDSAYTYDEEELWVQTDTYVYGHVYDLGGKNQPNIHLMLQNGDSVKVSTDMETLAKDDDNRLYKDQLVHISAEQNLNTKKLRNESLVAFENYNPHFDEKEFLEIVEQVDSAWSDVPDSLKWLETLRGNYV